MALHSYCGVPGCGKTFLATSQALFHYKKQNNIFVYSFHKFIYKIPKLKEISRYEYYCQFPKNKINNIYTTYPVLLDKKNDIWSNRISLWDLNNDYSFQPNAFIVIDEVQLYADSDEYKDKIVNAKLGRVAKFLQAHRHFGVDTIILISQNPSRIFKKARNICEDYTKIKLLKIPIINIWFMVKTAYFDLDYYGKFIPRSREEKKKLPFDYKKRYKIFNRKKLKLIFNSYDSRYLANYNYNKPLLNKGVYENKRIEFDLLEKLFE